MQEGSGRSYLWLVPIAAVLAGAPYAWFTRSRQPIQTEPVSIPAPAAAAVPRLSFHVERQASDLRLEWDRKAVSKLDPAGAMLVVTDGGADRTQFLSPEELSGGSLLYVPHTGDVLFRLKVNGKDGDVEEQFRVLGPTPEVAEMKLPVPRKTYTAHRAIIAPRSSPEPVRMIAAAWPKSIPRRVPVQVRIRVWVDAGGKVVRAAPVNPAAARDRFVESAIAAARHWSFAPARTDRGAVPAETVLTFQFKP
jgi:TonB family protein